MDGWFSKVASSLERSASVAGLAALVRSGAVPDVELSVGPEFDFSEVCFLPCLPFFYIFPLWHWRRLCGSVLVGCSRAAGSDTYESPSSRGV